MNYYKLTILSKGKPKEIILKGIDKAEILRNAHNKYRGIIVKVESIPMPFEEKLKHLKHIIKGNFSKKKLRLQPFISALRQLAALTKAQISLKDSLNNIAQNTSDPLTKELFLKSAEGIDNGLSLSATFEEYEQYVGTLAISMIKLGEETGALGEALESLSDVYEDIEMNRQKFKKAMRYPIITLTAMAIAFTILIMYVVPKFKDIFESLHAQLPLPTRILLGLEYLFNNYGLLVLVSLFAFFVLNKFLYKTNETYRKKMDYILLKMKIIGPIIENSSLNRFLLVLTELSKAGIPLVDSLTIASGILENVILKEKIDNIIRDINQGRSLAKAIEEQELLNNITLQMVSAGEKAGNLDVMLQNATEYYKNQFDQLIDHIGDAIEPIMLAVIGGLVLLLALGIFLPMWDLASAAKA